MNTSQSISSYSYPKTSPVCPSKEPKQASQKLDGERGDKNGKGQPEPYFLPHSCTHVYIQKYMCVCVYIYDVMYLYTGFYNRLRIQQCLFIKMVHTVHQIQIVQKQVDTGQIHRIFIIEHLCSILASRFFIFAKEIITTLHYTDAVNFFPVIKQKLLAIALTRV